MSTEDHPDWWRPMGGQNSQDSTLERRSLIWNDNGVLDGVDPPAFYTCEEYVGKFFTRGCRGMIEEIQIYCRDAGVNRLRLYCSPHPCLGPLTYVDITPLDTWAWRAGTLEEMWNYDSLFIWVYACYVGVDWAYDTEQPYDGHEATYPGHTWAALDIRPFIRVVYTGETPGDVPVSGIINTIPIPSSSSLSFENDYALPADSEVALIAFDADGYCDYVEARVEAAVNSHLTYIRVYCDDVLAMEQQFIELNARGHTPDTPTVSLPAYAVDGLCVLLLHKRFEFRRTLSLRAYNLPNPQTVTIAGYPTTLR